MAIAHLLAGAVTFIIVRTATQMGHGAHDCWTKNGRPDAAGKGASKDKGKKDKKGKDNKKKGKGSYSR